LDTSKSPRRDKSKTSNRKVVLSFYSSRVDFTMGTCILLGLGLLSLGGVALLTPFVGSCAVLLLVCRTAPSVRYTGPCSDFDVDIATLGGSHRVDLRWGFRVEVGAAPSSIMPLHHSPTCIGIHPVWCIVPSLPVCGSL
jgi:hypothetical protein